MKSEEKQLQWDTTWLLFARMMADRHSKCASKSVACVIVKDEKPISIGINGTPSQHVNCNEIYLKQEGILYTSRPDHPVVEESIERNGILFIGAKIKKNTMNGRNNTRFMLKSTRSVSWQPIRRVRVMRPLMSPIVRVMHVVWR